MAGKKTKLVSINKLIFRGTSDVLMLGEVLDLPSSPMGLKREVGIRPVAVGYKNLQLPGTPGLFLKGW
jgi:hypothetical protein